MNESTEEQHKNFLKIADLQDELLSLDFDNELELNSFKKELFSSPLLDSKWTFRSVLVSIYTCFLCRPHSDFNYINLFIDVAKLPKNSFRSIDYVLNFTNKFFILQLYKAGLVTEYSLYSQSTHDDYYLAYFYPEIKEYYKESPFLYDEYEEYVKKSVDLYGYNFDEKDKKRYLDKYLELRSEGKNPNKIALSIRDDDVESLQQLLYQTNESPDQIVQRSIFERFTFINEIQKEFLPTLIEYAAFFGSIKCFKFLYQKVSRIPQTVAKFAVAGGNYEIIHLCEESHIQFDSDSMMISIRFFQQDVTTYLEENFDIKKTMDDVSKSIVYYNLRSLIDCEDVIRDDPNKWDSNGYTALSLASLNGDLDIINYLVTTFGEKIDLDRKTDKGNTPFYLASGYGHFEIVRFYLESQKVDINATNQDEMTALHFACQRGQFKVVKFLCGLPNIDINADCGCNRHPIDYAVENGHIEIIKFLAELPGVVIYNRASMMNSIFEYSVMSERIDVVKLVFELVYKTFDKMEDKDNFLKNDTYLSTHIGSSFTLAAIMNLKDIADFIKKSCEQNEFF